MSINILNVLRVIIIKVNYKTFFFSFHFFSLVVYLHVMFTVFFFLQGSRC